MKIPTPEGEQFKKCNGKTFENQTMSATVSNMLTVALCVALSHFIMQKQYIESQKSYIMAQFIIAISKNSQNSI